MAGPMTVRNLTSDERSAVMVRAEEAVSELLEVFHPDPDGDGARQTPGRVARAWKEMTRGYGQDPAAILGTSFEKGGYDGIVALSPIRFYSTCEHHLLPFYGTAGVAYLPGERVVGLSKLARVVECFARRFQIQERLTREIADAIDHCLRPQGVAVIVDAHHMCMMARGVAQEAATMRTSTMLGCFRDQPEARAEVMSLLSK